MGKKKIKNNKIINIFSNQKGMALLTTLIFTFVLVSLGVALLTMTSNDSKLSTLQRDSTKAFYQAETGIEKAIWYLNSSEENTDGLDYHGTLTAGTTSEYYEVLVGVTISGTPDTKTLISTGKIVGGGEFDKGTRKIEVKLKKGISPNPGLNYDYAILTDGNMNFNGGISVHGNIHANGNLDASSTTAFNLDDGVATACGSNNVGDPNKPNQKFPQIDWDHFRLQAEDEIDGGFYYDEDSSTYGETTKVFNVPETLTGIHYVDGNVVIKTDLILQNAAIFANGTITVLGSGNVTLDNDLAEHPLALIAKGDITIGGSVHGEGIIQTEGSITNNGIVDINEGAIYAESGVFNGGGGATFNIYYGTDLATTPVTGTGDPVWKKTSWREVY